MIARLAEAKAWHQSGNLAAAEPVYRALAAAHPDQAEIWFLLGMLVLQKGHPVESVQHLRRAVAADPTHAKAFNALGAACNALGDAVAAEAALRSAIALQPDFADASHNLARVLIGAAADKAEAEAILRRLLAASPANAALHSDLGTLLYRTKRRGEAETAFRTALDLAPDRSEAARNLAAIYKTDGRDAEARALAPRIRDPLARFMVETTTPSILPSAERIPEVEAAYLAALAGAPDTTVADPLAAFAALGHFYFAYYDRPLKAVHEATADCYRRLCPSLRYEAAHCRPPRPPHRRRARVGFVSANFHTHTIHRLFAGLVIGLADHFEVLAIAAPGPSDDAIERLGRAVPLRRLPTDLARARQAVADLQADILVYLDIGMEPFTYFLAHARLAPLQLVTWGHPVTPGLDSIDGFVSAEYLSPDAAQADHTETVLRLPAPAFCFDRPAIAPRDRDAFGLPDGKRIYVCPQTLFKLHPDFDPLMAAILRDDPDGRVVLLAGDVPARKAALQERFARTLPDVAERVVFLPALPRQDFLSLLAMSDVMLDIPSFAGGNTTLEGLAAGVPVVTLPSAYLRGRLTAALLRMAGLEDGIAQSADDYCRRALALAHDGTAFRTAIADQAGGLFQRRQAVADFAALLTELLENQRST